MKLLEDRAKHFLRTRKLPVPAGTVAASAGDAAVAASALGARVAVKALVAAGRRGKAGAVKIADGAEAAAAAAHAMLGTSVAGRRVERVYVESAVDIAEEFYLSFGFGTLAPRIVVSRHGGVDIEAVARETPEAVVSADIDPRAGLTAWAAVALWERAGVAAARLPALGAITVRLYEAFRAADALMLEVNPLALTRAGELAVVGTMLEVDANALYRHEEWSDLDDGETGPGGRPLSVRERAVREANRRFPGGAVRYTELEGDIALFVSGGGAGLLQHDLMLAAGGRPANHSDLSPTPTIDKPAAMLEAILGNPAARGLLIGFNYLQLAPCDPTIEALRTALAKSDRDPARFPIVVRLFGPREDEARRLAASIPGLRYMPHGASLAEGVQAIVDAVHALDRGAS